MTPIKGIKKICLKQNKFPDGIAELEIIPGGMLLFGRGTSLDFWGHMSFSFNSPMLKYFSDMVLYLQPEGIGSTNFTTQPSLPANISYYCLHLI